MYNNNIAQINALQSMNCGLQNNINPNVLKGMAGANAEALSDEMQQLKNNMIN